jgi:hypothetical protein
MTTSPSPAAPSHSPSSGVSLASLPRWRQFLSTLNWRRDPGYEQSIVLHEQRMKQLASDIERSEERAKQIENEIEQIERETEQLRLENAREKALSALIRQRCFPPESSSIPPLPTESDCSPSLH